LRSGRGFALRSRSSGMSNMGKYKGRWTILVGFKAENLKEIAPIVEKLKEEYPKQEWNVVNSRFEQYDFLLCGFAEDRDEAHKIGLAVVRKHMPSHLNLLYWTKEVNLVKYNIRKTCGSSVGEGNKHEKDRDSRNYRNGKQ